MTVDLVLDLVMSIAHKKIIGIVARKFYKSEKFIFKISKMAEEKTDNKMGQKRSFFVKPKKWNNENIFWYLFFALAIFINFEV